MKINKKHISYGVVIVGILIILFFVIFGGEKESLYDTAVATRGDLTQEVSVTGRVQSSQRVNLAFEKTGKIVSSPVSIGDQVSVGTVLARLSSADTSAQLAQAESNVKIQRAKLNELLLGSRDEEIVVQQVKVANAEISLQEKETSVVNTLRDGFTKSDDAIRNKIDQFYSNPYSNAPQINLILTNTQLKTNVEQGRVNTENILNEWQNLLVSVSVSDVSIIKGYLATIKGFMDDVGLAVNSATPSSSITQATIDGYKTDVSTARTSINTAITNTSTVEESYKTAQSALTLAEKELLLKEAGTVEEQIIAQEAKLEEASASVRNYQAQLAKTVLRAPFGGIVTKQEARVGEISTVGSVVVSLIANSQFEIEVNIPEADIAKVSLENKATVTLDAYGSDIVFNASVVAVEPAETIIEGVATYTTTLQFDELDERVRSGMTANIDILTGSKFDVVLIPTRAVLYENGSKIVRVLKGDTFDRVDVITGLRGTDGNMEILNGISEGDEVIVFIKN